MTTSTDSTESHQAGDPAFVSNLKEGHQRFLAYAIEHSFVCGRRTAHDFIRHFPPKSIMKGLEHHAELRATILVLTTGLKQKIAIKKEWEDAATDLQIALDEGETDADSIVELLHSDDRVRYLDPQKIWSFLTEGEFWKTPTSAKPQSDVARAHLAFMLERALEDKLLTHRDVVEGASVDELANRLPKPELGRIIQYALENAHKGTSFTEADLLATTPPRTLVQHVPLAHLWDTVVVPKIAERHGYLRDVSQVVASPAAVPAMAAASLVTPKPALAEVTSIAKDPNAQKAQIAKPKDAATVASNAASKDPLKIKPKSALPEVPPPPQPDGMPGVHKSAADYFGDESDDIEVIEDDAKAV